MKTTSCGILTLLYMCVQSFKQRHPVGGLLCVFKILALLTSQVSDVLLFVRKIVYIYCGSSHFTVAGPDGARIFILAVLVWLKSLTVWFEAKPFILLACFCRLYYERPLLINSCQ